MNKSPHIASLRRFGRWFEIAVLSLGLVTAAWLLLTGFISRFALDGESDANILWGVGVLLALALWHRLMPAIGHAILDKLEPGN